MSNTPLPTVAKQHLTEAQKRIRAIYPSAYDIGFCEMGGVLNVLKWYNIFQFRDVKDPNHTNAVRLVAIKLDTPGLLTLREAIRGERQIPTPAQ